MIGSLAQAATGLVGAAVSAANTKQTNAINLLMNSQNNVANRLLVERQNQLQKEENELAYKRSTAGHQVNLLTAAGMSRAGAINALNGGGSYTPSPVNTSQDQAPPPMQTADLSGLASVGQALGQLAQFKHDEKMQAKQLAASKEQQQAQLESNERIAQLQADTTNRNADNRLGFDREKWSEEVKEVRARVNNISENTNYTSEQRKHFRDLRPILKDTAFEELNRVKKEISNIEHVQDMDYKRYKLEQIRTTLEAYYGVSIEHLRNTLKYWEEKPETLYKGLGFRKNTLKELSQREIDFQNYLDEVKNILEDLD